MWVFNFVISVRGGHCDYVPDQNIISAHYIAPFIRENISFLGEIR